MMRSCFYWVLPSLFFGAFRQCRAVDLGFLLEDDWRKRTTMQNSVITLKSRFQKTVQNK